MHRIIDVIYLKDLYNDEVSNMLKKIIILLLIFSISLQAVSAQEKSTAPSVHYYKPLSPGNADKKDSDSDGLPDNIELLLGTDPYNKDSFGDGIDDYTRIMILKDIPAAKKNQEALVANSHPAASSSSAANSHSVASPASNQAIDSDNDGLTDYQETSGIMEYNGHSIKTDPTKDDTDDDGLKDGVEISGIPGYITNPTKADTDGDGLNDLNEYWWQCDPTNPDTNNDGIRDGLSVDYSSPSRTYPYMGPLNQTLDMDGDGLPTAAEINDTRLKTNFKEYSTDGDPYGDGQEYFGIGMPIISPADHPLVAACPILKVKLSRIRYTPTGEITTTSGTSNQTAWSTEAGTSDSMTNTNELGVSAAMAFGWSGLEAGYTWQATITASYNHAWEHATESTSTSSSSGFTQRDWSTANTINKERAALISFIFDVENTGTVPAQDITPYINLMLGKEEIATIGSMPSITSLPTGCTSKNLAVKKDENGEIAVSLDQLKSIECGTPLTIQTFQINAKVKKWDDDKKEWVLIDQDFSTYMDEIDKKTATLLVELDDFNSREYKVVEGLTLGDALNLTVGRDKSIAPMNIPKMDLGFPIEANASIQEIRNTNKSILDIKLKRGWIVSIRPQKNDLRITWASYDRERKVISASVTSSNRIENVFAHVKVGDKYNNLTMDSPDNGSIYYLNITNKDFEIDKNCYVTAEDFRGNSNIYYLLDQSLPKKSRFQEGKYIIISKYSEKAMECSGESNGYNVYQYDCCGGPSQRWSLEYVGKGDYNIGNEQYINRYLEVDESKQSEGANVQEGWYDASNPSQQWYFVPNGDGTCAIFNSYSGKCLAVDWNLEHYHSNASIIQQKYQGQDNQKWIVQPVGCYPLNLSLDWSCLLNKAGFAIKSKSLERYLAIDKWDATEPTPQTNLTLWKLQPIGDGYFALMNIPSFIEYRVACLQAAPNGLNVSLGEYKRLDNQMWRFKRICDGQYAVCVKSSNKCLGLINDSGSSLAFQLGEYQGYEDQKFYVAPKKSQTVQGLTNYKVRVYTGKDSGAGTDAWISINLHGPLDENNRCASTGKQLIAALKEDFENGNIDEFDLKSVTEVGDISEIVIGFDSTTAGDAWELDKIEVYDTITGKTYTFPFSNWMDNYGDYTIPSDNAATKQLTDYKVWVTTGKDSGAGTNAWITIDLHGPKDMLNRYACTGRQLIGAENEYFENGKTDEFDLKRVTEVKDISQIEIGFHSAGSGPPWELDKVVVYDTMTKKTYTFPYDNKWIDTDGNYPNPEIW